MLRMACGDPLLIRVLSQNPSGPAGITTVESTMKGCHAVIHIIFSGFRLRMACGDPHLIRVLSQNPSGPAGITTVESTTKNPLNHDEDGLRRSSPNPCIISKSLGPCGLDTKRKMPTT